MTPIDLTRLSPETVDHALARIAGRSQPAGDCLLCTYATNVEKGYPQIVVGGRKGWRLLCHRLVCYAHHGPPPTTSHEAAHSCGNARCVNPAHLRWATSRENAADARAHGTTAAGERNAQARLTRTVVDEIRARLVEGQRQMDVAVAYGMSPGAINDIAKGRTWQHARPVLEGLGC